MTEQSLHQTAALERTLGLRDLILLIAVLAGSAWAAALAVTGTEKAVRLLRRSS